MKVFLSVFFLFNFLTQSIGQTLKPQWSHNFGIGAGGKDECKDMVIDKHGNMYAAGIFLGKNDFSSPINRKRQWLNASAEENIYFCKYDRKGKLLWAKSLEARGRCSLVNINLDDYGNLIICGNFGLEIDLDPGMNETILRSDQWPAYKGFVAKYDSEGHFIWGHAHPSDITQRFNSMGVDHEGNVLISGYLYDSQLDMDPGPGVANIKRDSSFAFFIAKYNPKGKLLWARSMNIGHGLVSGIDVDLKNNIYLNGYYQSYLVPDPQQPNLNLKHNVYAQQFVIKLSPGSIPLWSYQTTGSRPCQPNSFRVSPGGQTTITGLFMDTANFNPKGMPLIRTVGSITKSGIFLLRLNSDGTPQWVKTFSDPLSNCYSADFASDPKGNLFLVGYLRGRVDFDPGSDTAYLENNQKRAALLFMAKYDSTGKFMWVNSLPSTTVGSRIRTIAVDSFGSFWIGGEYTDSLDLDPSTDTSLIYSDVYYLQRTSFMANYDTKKGGVNMGFSSRDSKGQADHMVDFDIDEYNNIYACGVVSGGVNIDPECSKQTIGTQETFQGYLAKYDSAGRFQWVLDLQPTSSFYPQQIIKSTTGEIILTGFVNGRVDLDPSQDSFWIESFGHQDVFVASYTSEGAFNWGTSISCLNYSYLNGMAVDSLGNVWISTSHGGKTILKGSKSLALDSTNYISLYLTKLNSKGAYQFHKTLGGYGNVFRGKLSSGPNGSIYVTSKFYDSLDLDPGTNRKVIYGEDYPMFLARYDSSGALLWGEAFSGDNEFENIINTINAAPNGVLFIGGRYRGRLDFDLSTASKSFETGHVPNAFLASYTPKGALRFIRSYGSSKGNYLSEVTDIDFFNKKLLVSGNFSDSVDFDHTIKDTFHFASFRRDPFILQMNAKGDFIRSHHLLADYGSPVAIRNTSDGFIIGGSYMGKLDISLGLGPKEELKNTGYYTDIFLVKYSSTGSCKKDSVFQRIKACGSFKPKHGCFSYDSNGTYIDTFINRFGCDSIVVTELDISRPKDTILIEKSCRSYLSPSGKYHYTQSGSYIDTLLTTEGCDSILHLRVQISSPEVAISFNNDSLVASGSFKYYQWVKCLNDSVFAIDSANAKNFKPNKSGKYALIAGDSFCLDTSACLEVQLVGIPEWENGFRIYPNPFNAYLQIESNHEPLKSLELQDASGRILIQKNQVENKSLFDTHALNPGIYLLKLEIGDQLVTKLIVKS